MFQAAAPPIGEPIPEAPPAPLSSPAQAAPGEFTRLFQAPAPTLNEAKPEIPPAPAPQSTPGSFTQMFQAAAPPIGEKKTEATRKAPAPLEPGEFTRFFNAASAAPPISAPMPPKAESQGDFDRIFGSSERPVGSPSTVTGIFRQSSSTPAIEPKQADSASSLTAPPAFTPPPGDFTRVFGETSPGIPSPVAAPPTPASPSPASGPGEYTRMFSAQPIPPEPIAAPTPAPVIAPESQRPVKQNSMLVPILIGVIVLLLAAIAVILVAIK
jgi:hypothetical protein